MDLDTLIKGKGTIIRRVLLLGILGASSSAAPGAVYPPNLSIERHLEGPNTAQNEFETDRFTVSELFQTADDAIDYANSLPLDIRRRVGFFSQFYHGSPSPASYHAMVDNAPMENILDTESLKLEQGQEYKWEHKEGFTQLKDAVAFVNEKRTIGRFVSYRHPQRNPNGTTTTVFYLVPTNPVRGRSRKNDSETDFLYNIAGEFATARDALDHANSSLVRYYPSLIQFVPKLFPANQVNSRWNVVYPISRWDKSDITRNPWQAVEQNSKGDYLNIPNALEIVNMGPRIKWAHITPEFSTNLKERVNRNILFYARR